MMMNRFLYSLMILLGLAGSAGAACVQTVFDGARFTYCEVGRGDDLRLFWRDDQGKVLGSFRAVNKMLAVEGKMLGFAMNAGMYHSDYTPVGLYIEKGRQYAPLVTGASDGNFGLLPNGVFCLGREGFAVMESRHFAASRAHCAYATQSGPMLVRKGELHPRFLPDSDSLYIRNGVGVSADGQRAVFAISDDAVNFHLFARFFRDGLKLPDALYLDGSISRLYAPAVRRNDFGLSMGPIVGIAVPKE